MYGLIIGAKPGAPNKVIEKIKNVEFLEDGRAYIETLTAGFCMVSGADIVNCDFTKALFNIGNNYMIPIEFLEGCIHE